MARFPGTVSICCILILVSSIAFLPGGLSEDIPDLIISDNSISLFVGIPYPDPLGMPRPTEFYADAMVLNQGNKGALDFVVVFFHDMNFNRTLDDNETIGSVFVPYLQNGDSTEVKTLWTGHPVDEGVYQVCVHVNPVFDNPHLIGESDYENNVACYEFEIKGSYVDYVPASYCKYPLWVMTYWGAEPYYPLLPADLSCVFAVGDRISLKVGMLNIGTIGTDMNSTLRISSSDAPGFETVSLEFSPQRPLSKRFPWGERYVGEPSPSLPVPRYPIPIFFRPCCTDFVALNWSASTPGTYHFTLEADYGNRIQESNESNNVLTVEIIVECPPETSLLYSGPAYMGDILYVKSSTKFGFYVEDPSNVGIKCTSYRIDRGNWQCFNETGLFSIEDEGLHEIEYGSMNEHLLFEETRSMEVFVDDTPPQLYVSQKERWLFSTEIALIGNDHSGSGVAGIEYSVDGEPWTSYSGPFTIDDAGTHTIEYRTVDNLGNELETSHLSMVVTEPGERINWNPLVASILALILGVLGYFYLLKYEKKGLKELELIETIPFLLLILPFVALELTLGIASLFDNSLSIPPWAGGAMLLDLIVIDSGLVALVFWISRESRPRD